MKTSKRDYLGVAMMAWLSSVLLGSYLDGKCGIEYFLFAVSLALLGWFSSSIHEAIGNCLSKIIKRQQIKGKWNE